MEAINRKIYDLATQSNENFELVFDIHQRYDSIIHQLGNDFWEDFLKYIKSNNEVYIYEKVKDDCIYLKHTIWKRFQAYIEWRDNKHIYFGIFVNDIKSKNKLSLLSKQLQIIHEESFYSFDQEIGLEYKVQLDFNIVYDLQKLLKDNRNELISSIMQPLLDISKQYNEDILSIEENL